MNRPLRDELRDLFDRVSEPAHPALAARIRAEIAGREGQPPRRAPRLAVAAAIVVAIAVVTSLVLAGRQGLQLSSSPATRAHPAPVPSALAETPAPAPSPAVSATPAPAATGTPPAATTPVPNGAALPGFTCGVQTGGGATGGSVTAVRAGPQSGYDRFVIELTGSVGQYQAKPQGNATFTQDASGQQVNLAGSAGLVVTLHDTSSHGTYTGPTDLRPAGTANLEEARQMGDFEGVVTWGLGLARPSCFRAFTLSGPSRLVVDVQA